MSSEEEIRRLIVELRILEGTAEALQSRMNLVDAMFAELNLAKKTLEGMGKEKPEAPVFVPIGGGSYIKAKITDVDKVVYGVGAGVSIEKSLEEAKQGVDERISELERTKRSLEQQFSQVIRRIQENRERLQELTAEQRREERA
ncbi:prefoldin subunit alpha [Candidatus Bathyarchaeota archaeon]|nr:prefoldin subunit alpha [Candidatus Bathyarchaeota archaeon]RJS88091.1 MAG: prefoldin subunit alpha [Candidatus Bathyarchaeota archaeon]